MKVNTVSSTRRRLRILAVFVSVLVVLLLSTLISALLGQYHVGVGDVYRSLFGPLNLSAYPEDPTAFSTLWNIRFPRIALGILVGAGLAVAGALMQAVFSNPLAEPGIIGVSSGASVGAALALVYAPHALGGFSVPMAAFLSARRSGPGLRTGEVRRQSRRNRFSFDRHRGNSRVFCVGVDRHVSRSGYSA